MKNILGKGNTAEVFEYDTGRICKLFFEGYPQEYIQLEFHNAKEFHNSGISSPKPYEMIYVGKRNGIVYERIDGKTLADLMQENKYDCDKMLDMLVRLHQDILSRHTNTVISYKEFLGAVIRSKTAAEQLLVDKISELPDDNCLLHGDFHPHNILIKADGTPVIIDFMNVCHGPVLYDIARTFFLLEQSNKSLAKSYIDKMNVVEKDIKQYINIIIDCRKYEAK